MYLISYAADAAPSFRRKLSTNLAFSETQRRSVKARESPNDEGKTPRRKRFFFTNLSPSCLDFLLYLLSVGFQSRVAKVALECFFSHVSIYKYKYNRCLILPFRAAFRHDKLADHVTKNFCLTCMFVSVGK